MMSERFRLSDLRAPLVIDQAPLIGDALDRCQHACRLMEKFRAELQAYETRHLPAYERWVDSAFSHYQMAIREITRVIQEKEEQLSVLKKRHWANFFGGSCRVHAETGLGRGGTSRSFRNFDDDSYEEFHEDEDEEEGDYGPGFEEFLYDEEDPETDDWESERLFEEILKQGSAYQGPRYRGRGWTAGASEDSASRKESSGFRFSGSEGSKTCYPSPDDTLPEEEDSLSRVKDRYRLLVKKLHPDLHPNLSAEQKKLWNQVQVAYRERNLPQLDLLIALADAFSGEASRSTSLHHLRQAIREIERALSPLRRKIEEVRKSRAWGFLDLEERSALRRSVEADFQKDLDRLRQKLGNLKDQLSRFSRTAGALQNETRAE